LQVFVYIKEEVRVYVRRYRISDDVKTFSCFGKETPKKNPTVSVPDSLQSDRGNMKFVVSNIWLNQSSDRQRHF
jgi:hypothetical protein